MVFLAKRMHFFQASIKLAQPFSGPRIADNKFTDTRTFLTMHHLAGCGSRAPGPTRRNDLSLRTLALGPQTPVSDQ